MQIPLNTKQQSKILQAAKHKKVQDRLKQPYKGYVRFSVEKKSGGRRWIHAPHYIVKSAQKTVLAHLPSPSVKQYGHEVITGFIPGMSILDNARPHVGKQVVLSVDLKNFFPSFTRREVNSLFPGGKYANVRELVTSSSGKLPQGAATSPMLANWLCKHSDEFLAEFCTKHKIAYTRYADDLTFSSLRDIDQDVVDSLFNEINLTLFGNKVRIAPNKVKFMRRHKQQRVTGIVVNEKLSIPRARRKQLRAFMHDCEVNGVQEALSRFNRSIHHIFGEFSFLHLAHQQQAEKYIEQFKELL